MSNKDIIAKIKAEIERRMDKHWEGLPNADAPEDDWTHNELCELGAYKELEHLETFLSTLESEKPVPNDLEEAAKEYAKTTFKKPYSDNPDEEVTIVEPDKYAGFIAGAKWDRSQMMKEAVEGMVRKDGTIGYFEMTDEQQFKSLLEKFQDGDKVRIIIVKED